MTVSVSAEIKANLTKTSLANAARVNQIRVELSRTGKSNSHTLQSDMIELNRFIEAQKRTAQPIVESVRRDMLSVAMKASELCKTVRELDLTISNLERARLFITGIEELRNVRSLLDSCIEEGKLEQAVAIVRRIKGHRTIGVFDAVGPDVVNSFTKLETDLANRIKQELTTPGKTSSQPGYAKMIFALGQKEEGLGIFIDQLLMQFGDKCAKHLSKDVSLASTGAGGRLIDTENPVYLDTVVNIFLEVAEIVQHNQKTIEIEFDPASFGKFVVQIEGAANSYSAKVIRNLMKATNVVIGELSNAVNSSNSGLSPPSQEAGNNLRRMIPDAKVIDDRLNLTRCLDYALEQVVTIVMRCKQFMSYTANLMKSAASSNESSSITQGLTSHSNDPMKQLVEELCGIYVSGEQALMHALIVQAIDDDTVDEYDSYNKTSSVVDDTFFIFKKALNRSILTTDPNCPCAIVNNIVNVAQSDLREYLEISFGDSKRLFAYCIGDSSDNPCNAIYKHCKEESQFVLRGGRILSSDSLPHAVSNISQTWGYLSNFKQHCMESFDNGFSPVGTSDFNKYRTMFQQCISGLDLVVGEMNELHVSCSKYILLQCRGVYISNHISVIDGTNFDINEVGFSEYQINDPYMKAFIASLEALIKWIRAIVNSDSAKMFFILLSDYIALRLERSLLQRTRSTFSILGATQFYQDIARLLSFISQSTEVPVRNKYGRLQELCSILCLESVAEYTQIYGSGGTTSLRQYKITPTEVKAVLSLRHDLNPDSISTIN